MPASPSSLIAALSNAPASLCAQELAIDLPAALARLPDPRARRGIRHQLVVVVTAAVCAVVAGYRSYTAIGEWVADLPADTAVILGIDADRRPSEAMIRRLLQALDPDLPAAAIGTWLAVRIPAPSPGSRRAIAVDGKPCAAHAAATARPGMSSPPLSTAPARSSPAPTSTPRPMRSPGSGRCWTRSLTYTRSW